MTAGDITAAAHILRPLKNERLVGLPEMRARLALKRRDWKSALAVKETDRPDPLLDTFLSEPCSRELWPWLRPQISALASAEAGRPEKGATLLVSREAGSLPELRDAVVRGTKAGRALIQALAERVEKARESWDRVDAATSLARLQVIGGQVDAAAATLHSHPEALASFCQYLPELLWHAPAVKDRPERITQIRGLCSTTEEPACAIVP